ncbi:MAG: bifunctional phosphoribosyl-AMP cyclohydrolase/phosphoribosyl-ATP diphosphatase HisIE [Thermoanaerobaculia bacterium]
MTLDLDRLAWDERGLVTVVVREIFEGGVRMVAHADRAALAATLVTGRAHFWSRSRRTGWRKGETSGNELEVIEVSADCDGDAVLYRARARGPTCHTGRASCFGDSERGLDLGGLAAIVAGRAGADPATSYTARLVASGVERIAQKVGEEGVETALAAVAPMETGGAERLVAECADLLYHVVVLLAARGVPLSAVAEELARRHAAAGARPL